MKALKLLYKLRDLDTLLDTVTEDVEIAIAELEALQVDKNCTTCKWKANVNLRYSMCRPCTRQEHLTDNWKPKDS